MNVRTASGPPRDGAPDRAHSPLGPLLLVAAACLFSLVNLTPELAHVPYANDSSVHLAMVRWAAHRISEGHLPFDGWFPYLDMGASRFHHYQSLPYVLAGSLATLIDPRTVFSWVQYLLIALWPICIYWSGRRFELPRWSSAAAALVSPLVVSAPGLGYEWGSYVWRGFGTWAQLWGMWLLPPAWALGWRAVSGRSGPLAASVVIALSVSCHLLTGYLAMISLGVWVLVAPSDLWRRIGRALVTAAGALLMTAWFLVPLLADRRYTAHNEFSTVASSYNSFGARRILTWLVTGQVFDAQRLPVLTVLVAVGLIVCVRGFRRTEWMRALLGAGLLSLLLFFGRSTLGPLLDLLPGSGDIFLRRYVIGVHLTGIYLAGVGGAWAGAHLAQAISRLLSRLRPALRLLAVGTLSVALLGPALADRVGYMSAERVAVEAQRRAEATDGADLRALLGAVAAGNDGRVFDGDVFLATPTRYRIGRVPVYLEALDADVDGIGLVRRTWSLSSAVEYRFDQSNPAQYDLFNVRYVLLPSGRSPAVPASVIESRGRSTLWRVATSGYVRLVDTRGTIEADRTTIGPRAAQFLTSEELADGIFRTIAFAGAPAAPTSLAPSEPVPPSDPGLIGWQAANLPDGRFQARVVADRPAVVLLKETFDPRWRVTVDGQVQAAQMIAPSFVGVPVPAGRHSVVFEYVPFPSYGGLFALGAVTFLLLAALSPRRRRRGTIESSPTTPVEEEATSSHAVS